MIERGYTVCVDDRRVEVRAHATWMAAKRAMMHLGVLRASKVTVVSGEGERAWYINARVERCVSGMQFVYDYDEYTGRRYPG